MKKFIHSYFSNTSKRFLLITGVLTFVAYLTQILLSGWVSLFAATFDFLFFAIVMTVLFRLLRRSSVPFFEQFLRYALLVAGATGVLSLLLWGGAFFSNTFPGALSKVTLSNGVNTIIYYQMSHIGTEKYYNTISRELSVYAGSGYKIYLEGVLPGTPENQNRLEQAIGMKLSSGTYEDIATLMGMSAQGKSLYAGVDSGSLIHADLSVDDIVANLSTGSLQNENPVDVFSEMNSLIDRANQGAISYIFRGLLNASLRYSLSGDSLLSMLDPSTVEALLDKRNRIVVDTYLAQGANNAVFLYGALHFDGIFAYLKSKDSKWELKSHEALYPYVK